MTKPNEPMRMLAPDSFRNELSRRALFQLGGAAGGLTQYDSPSVVQAVTTNGTAFGNLSNISIDEDGFVTAVFDNGVTRRIAQVAIATFNNPQGLRPLGSNGFAATAESGIPNMGSPNSGMAGSIQSGSLEQSNVDLSEQLVNLIVAQQTYQANSQTIKTQDQVLQTLVNLR